jgi:hypothetical protein
LIWTFLRPLVWCTRVHSYGNGDGNGSGFFYGNGSGLLYGYGGSLSYGYGNGDSNNN